MTGVPPAYDAWAPREGDWSAWVKAVPFAFLPEVSAEARADFAAHPPTAPQWLPRASDTALVLDLPGLDGIAAALAVAQRGYRPIPLYKACTGMDEVVQTRPLLWGLMEAAEQLRRVSLPIDSPPAFILDARRLSGAPGPGRFDNRSVVTADDFPTAARLRGGGVSRAIVVRHEPLEDLAAVLRRWRQDGIEITGCASLQETPGAVDLRRRWLRALLHRLFAWTQLKPTAAGGFGAHIPMSSGG